MLRQTSFIALFGLLFVPLTHAAPFDVRDDGKAITITEGGTPVLTYHHTWVDPPEGVEKRFRRTGYIHPLHGLDGEILTQDFPDDHYHHRGVFWGWPRGDWKGNRLDTWGLSNSRQVPVSVAHEIGGKSAVIQGENHWKLDEEPDTPIVSETYRIEVHPADATGRAIDFTITLKNLTDAPVTLKGAIEKNKGYGGFNFRPDKACKPMHFTTALGVQAEDTFQADTPWIDVSYAVAPGSETQSGAAIFQHPDNPDYPHPGWLVRHYGFLGHAWPGNDPYDIAPGKEVTLKYRLYVHRGDAEAGKVKEAHAAYLEKNSK